MVGCSNCVHGNPGPYWVLIALSFPITAAVLWLTLKRVRTLPTRSFRLTADALAMLCAVLLFLAPRPILHHMALPNGTICGSALSSSLMTGTPTNADLDPVQVNCKEMGETFVKQGVARYEWLGLAILGLLAVALVGEATRQERRGEQSALVP